MARNKTTTPNRDDFLCWHGSKSSNPRLAKVFDDVAENKQAAFIPYLTAGYPKKADTVDLLLALQVREAWGGGWRRGSRGDGVGGARLGRCDSLSCRLWYQLRSEKIPP